MVLPLCGHLHSQSSAQARLTTRLSRQTALPYGDPDSKVHWANMELQGQINLKFEFPHDKLSPV